jgi:hypothetical protein
MIYSVPLTMAADAILFELGVRQLAARIPLKGVAKRNNMTVDFKNLKSVGVP